jgi:hypothetical protein
MKILFVILMLISSVIEAKTLEEVKNTEFYPKVINATCNYYSVNGVKRSRKAITGFLDSSIRVALNYNNFPSKDQDFETRVLELFCYGAKESGYRKNFVSFNIPGTIVYLDYLKKPKTIRMFSVDFGWTGINFNQKYSNIDWAFKIATRLKNKTPLEPYLSNSLHPLALKYLRENLKIPKNVKLKKVNTTGFMPLKIAYLKNKSVKLAIPYEEKTKDDIDSMLYYRVIIETDRKFRNWPWRTWDKNLLAILTEATKPNP